MARLETMVLMSDVDLPATHVREQIAATVDLVLHMIRLPDGQRVIGRVTSVEGLAGGRPVLRDVFAFRRRGGWFEATGHVPQVARSLAAEGAPIDVAVFRAGPTDSGRRGDGLLVGRGER